VNVFAFVTKFTISNMFES